MRVYGYSAGNKFVWRVADFFARAEMRVVTIGSSVSGHCASYCCCCCCCCCWCVSLCGSRLTCCGVLLGGIVSHRARCSH